MCGCPMTWVDGKRYWSGFKAETLGRCVQPIEWSYGARSFHLVEVAGCRRRSRVSIGVPVAALGLGPSRILRFADPHQKCGLLSHP
jgi:hypothetical protein